MCNNNSLNALLPRGSLSLWSWSQGVRCSLRHLKIRPMHYLCNGMAANKPAFPWHKPCLDSSIPRDVCLFRSPKLRDSCPSITIICPPIRAIIIRKVRPTSPDAIMCLPTLILLIPLAMAFLTLYLNIVSLPFRRNKPTRTIPSRLHSGCKIRVNALEKKWHSFIYAT